MANIGSANFNTRSVYLDEEINVVLIDDDVVATLDAQFDEDLERSIQIEPGRWSERSRLQRARERLVTPIRRLF